MRFTNSLIAGLDRKLLEPDKRLTLAERFSVLLGSIIVYAGAFLVLSPLLGVSTNYFVLIPMFFASALFGLPGGILAGIMALPCNLLLFRAFGNLGYAPESRLVAWVFGFVTGSFLGYLGHFFRRLKNEIAEHREAREELKKAYNQKHLLLKESHHRIKNNLAIIHGIIELKSFETDDPDMSGFLKNLLERLRSLAIVQNLLYTIDSVDDIDTCRYIEKLVDNLKHSLAGPRKEIRIETEISDVCLDIDQALAVGLIINEAFTNTVKYAFERTQNPAIRICIERYGKRSRFIYRDNGSGIPEAVLKGTQDRMGLRLIQRLAGQLSGTVTITGDEGTRIELVF
ncbi:MAG: sensor histidine kinase [Spirochaetia bacterium]